MNEVPNVIIVSAALPHRTFNKLFSSAIKRNHAFLLGHGRGFIIVCKALTSSMKNCYLDYGLSADCHRESLLEHEFPAENKSFLTDCRGGGEGQREAGGFKVECLGFVLSKAETYTDLLHWFYLSEIGTGGWQWQEVALVF